MKILSLESSTKNFSLAVSSGEKLLVSRDVRLKKVLSSSIIPGIESILKKSQLKLKDLDGFAVGLGPGSFTSLRVGLSTIRALSFVTGKPVVGFSSLHILAMNTPSQIEGPVCALVDAKRGLVFAATFEKAGETLKRTSEDMLISIPEALKLLKPGSFLIGDARPLYPDQWKKAKPQLALEKDCYPRASRLAVLAYTDFLKKNYQSSDAILPAYLYPEDCQVRRE